MRFVFFIGGLLPCLLFLSCASNAYTHRNQLILIDQKQEFALGAQSAQEIIHQSTILNNAQSQIVKKVGAKLAQAANRPDFQWEFYLVDKDIFNAFCLPGGKVFVYTGLMKIIQNEDELAVVMGHEIAHAILRHGAERMSLQTIQQLGGSLLGAFIPHAQHNLFYQAYNTGSQLGIILPYSRTHELEADRVGIILMQKAGYNPQAALSFWTKMQQQSKPNKTDFFSTHPSDQKRINEIKKILQ